MKDKNTTNQERPTFSLVLATYQRTDEVIRFLKYLQHQNFKNFELVVVDQNFLTSLSDILTEYQSKFSLIHISSEIGQSIARNIGLSLARGEIIAFPDDDCWYPNDLLHNINIYFNEHLNIDGIACRLTDENEVDYPGFRKKPGAIQKLNVWGRGSGPGIFLRREVIDAIGKFDETLGVAPGNRWGSSEDIDYILRAIEDGFEIYYQPSFIVYHPNPSMFGYEKLSIRAYSYGAGMGRLWRKHRFPYHYIGYRLSRSIGGAILSYLQGNHARARYQVLNFAGKLAGWRDR